MYTVIKSVSFTVAASPSPCTACDDVPTQWMSDNNHECATYGAGLTARCNNNANWRNGGFCRRSCFENGVGYAGDSCCPAPL